MNKEKVLEALKSAPGLGWGSCRRRYRGYVECACANGELLYACYEAANVIPGIAVEEKTRSVIRDVYDMSDHEIDELIFLSDSLIPQDQHPLDRLTTLIFVVEHWEEVQAIMRRGVRL